MKGRYSLLAAYSKILVIFLEVIFGPAALNKDTFFRIKILIFRIKILPMFNFKKMWTL
jgi:hypothetical protein